MNDDSRFLKPPVQPKIVSSLTDDELMSSFSAYRDYRASARSLANAAAQRTIEDLEPPSDEWFSEVQEYTQTPSAPLYYVLHKYLKDLREGKI